MINNLLKFRCRSFVYIFVFLLVLLPVLSISSNAALDDDEIAQRYAPVLYFEKEEECFPLDALYHIHNSYLYQVGFDEPRDMNPDPEKLKTYTTDLFYLDNQKGTVNDNGIIDDYQTELKKTPRKYQDLVYYRVFREGSTIVVQYWMFYAFNKGELNQHEGDWEMVQVVLSNDKPSWVAYSQHHSGQWATWEQVEKDGNNIKVYVARGSHANYLRSYSGKLGMASDIVGDNGKILKPGSYVLSDLEDQLWLDFAGNWGEVGEGDETVSSFVLGRAGPQGPKYREGGGMWNDPVKWGKNLPQANDIMFLVEWFVYNIITLIIVVTLVFLVLMFFLIYRRHKKHGLGPRIVSMFYIDGLNLKSIGNILCFVGIFIAIFGLFSTWYEVSYDFSGEGVVSSMQTEGWQSLIKIDGMDGIQIVVPGSNGPTPAGVLSLPISLFLGIGLVFLIIASIGVLRSTKLGFKYIWRGIRLFLPFILIIIVIVLMASVIPTESMGDSEGVQPKEIFGSISRAPFAGEESYEFRYNEENVEKTATLNMKWGLGLGGILLLIAGIILIISGVLEIFARTSFFEPKNPEVKPLKKKRWGSKKSEEPSMVQQQPLPGSVQPSQQQMGPPPPEEIGLPQKKSEDVRFCPKCGTKLVDGAAFCPECGANLK